MLINSIWTLIRRWQQTEMDYHKKLQGTAIVIKKWHSHFSATRTHKSMLNTIDWFRIVQKECPKDEAMIFFTHEWEVDDSLAIRNTWTKRKDSFQKSLNLISSKNINPPRKTKKRPSSPIKNNERAVFSPLIKNPNDNQHRGSVSNMLIIIRKLTRRMT